MNRILKLSLPFLLLAACNFDVDWFGTEESQNRSTLNEEGNSSHTDNNIDSNHQKKGDITDLILESSVTIEVKDQRNKTLKFGSGAFIDEDKIVTNFHVVESGITIEIILNSDENIKYNASILKIDSANDIAILKIDNPFPGKALKINQGYPKIGSDIIVAGSPLGLNGTLSKGNISAIRKFPPYNNDLFQISAPISPGSSGGPVTNLSGELIAISVSGLEDDRAQNLNFAIPAKYIYFLLDN